MYFSKLSLRNFGSFVSAEFSFAAKGLNVIQGANGTGKTQIIGAIFAALLGRAAIKVDKAGIGPAEVRLCIGETDTTEELSLAVEIGQHGEPLVRQSSGALGVDHRASPLTRRLLAAISDPTGSRILLPREPDSTTLTAPDIDAIGRSLPDVLKRDPTWLQLRAGAVLQDPILPGWQASMGVLLREFANRTRSKQHLPLIVDEFLGRLSGKHVDFSIKILNAIAEISQVIVVAYAYEARAFPAATVTSLDHARPTARSLAYYNDFIENRRPNPVTGRQHNWVLGQAFHRQEDRTCELKEITGRNPLSSIKNVVDQYAVAFLNAGSPQDGAIFWGIRNEDLKIIGVNLSDAECDELRRIVTEKLHQIAPPLAPTAYQVHLHPVSDGPKRVPNLYVVEVRIPSASGKLLFSTGSHEVYVKTDAGKKKLSAVEIQQELLHRLNIDPSNLA